ncbi:hypothetical protein LOY46_17915 [Pseudomonas sichuanensis]|uniref:hypothetical protein n=1 Tax=Pseudomonas sichuanensis TaxID=2213015 RepID=UPI00215FB3C6|nr:hypothetical protein [Pseudomonas sichuanensis]UVK81436.1 hypothetical protein LOY46_17915 [Pseudomonas sichuanensis]
MSKHLLPAPDLTEYRYALYCRADLFGLPDQQRPPVAIYRDEDLAIAHGQRMWPSAYTIIDLHGEDSPCGRPN